MMRFPNYCWKLKDKPMIIPRIERNSSGKSISSKRRSIWSRRKRTYSWVTWKKGWRSCIQWISNSWRRDTRRHFRIWERTRSSLKSISRKRIIWGSKTERNTRGLCLSLMIRWRKEIRGLQVWWIGSNNPEMLIHINWKICMNPSIR